MTIDTSKIEMLSWIVQKYDYLITERMTAMYLAEEIEMRCQRCECDVEAIKFLRRNHYVIFSDAIGLPTFSVVDRSICAN